MKFENEKGYIIIPDEARNGKLINWSKTINKTIKGCYRGIDFEIVVKDYSKEKGVLDILFNGKDEKIRISQIKYLNGFDRLIGIYNFDFKYEINQRIVDYDENGEVKRDFIIVDRKKEKDKNNHSWKYYKIKCNKCGFDGGKHYCNGEMIEEYWIREAQLINGHGCGCCGGQFCVTGINDMWTTDPRLAELLANKDDGYKYVKNTSNKLNFKCPSCENISKKNPTNIIRYNYKVPCNCNDGVSYPEKFVWSVLNMLNVDYIWQYSKATCDWIINNIKYDFYFKYNNEEYIIETHGCQHYERGFVGAGERTRTLEEEQENDRLKKELALKNGIKEENYIVIDCRKSDLEWIKNNILHSKLNEVFNLSNINWNQCGEYACKNIYKEICDMWNDLGDKKSTTMIEENTKFSSMLILTALKKGNELGWCDYDSNVNYRNDIYLKVTDLEDNLLGVYRGYKYLQDCSEEQFGKFLDHRYLFNLIKKNQKGEGNIRITSTSKDYFEENKNVKINYPYKKQYYILEKDSMITCWKTGVECANYINHKENVNTASQSVFTSISKKYPLYGYSIKKVWLTEQEFEKYHERNDGNEINENVK